MYFQGDLSIDPSEITQIDLVKPTKAFGKMLNFLTMGLATEKEERETFTAVSILQKLNLSFRSLGVTNIVRLAKDDVDFYLDEKGRTDDLKKAMESFEKRVSGTSSKYNLFDTLKLVLEHEDEELKYIMEIDILRVHKVGEYPIQVTVDGLMVDMHSSPEESNEELRSRLREHFGSQEEYESYTKRKKYHFDAFVDRIETAIRQNIGVDEIKKTSNSRIIRPKSPVRKSSYDEYYDPYHHDPLYYGYYGMSDYFLYSWIWSEMAYENDVYCHDCLIVDDQGQSVMEVGESGFQAGENNTLNPESEFEAPESGDLEYHGDNAYAETLSESGLFDDNTKSSFDAIDSSDWADSLSSDSGSDSSSSSCSSCSSCGGSE